MRNDTKKFQSQRDRLQKLITRLMSIEQHLIATDKSFELHDIQEDKGKIRDMLEFISATHMPLSKTQMQIANAKWNSIKQKYPNIK